MKRLILGLLMFFFIGISYIMAQDPLLKLQGIFPSENSAITDFDFTITFDISEVIQTYGDDQYGIGWVGFHNDKLPAKEKSISLYEGNDETGILLGRTCTSNFTGKTDGFTPGNSIRISFPGLIPTEGKVYTLVITNEFKVYTKDKGATSLANTTLSYFDSPYKCSFIGGKASNENLTLVGSSIQSGSDVERLSELTYTFNIPVNIASDTPLQIKEGDNIVAESENAFLSEDMLSVTYKFNDINLYLSHLYSISLPQGLIVSVDNPNLTNEAFDITFNGSSIIRCNLKYSSPTDGSCYIFDKIECVFDMPSNYIMYHDQSTIVNHKLYIYEDIIDEEHLQCALNGTVNSSQDGFTWSNTLSLKPGRTYICYIPEGQIRAYSTITNNYAKDCANAQVLIRVTTPSIEESGYPPIVLGDPVIGKHDAGGSVLKNGDAIGSIDLLEIAPVDIFYTGKDGESKFRLSEDTFKHTGYLYDITSGTPELIKEVSLNVVQRETSFYYYTVISAPLSSVFFEGHRYRFVIPRDEFTILYPPLYNYVRTPEYSIEFEGSTPTEARLVSSTLQDGEELSELGNVVWTFKGQFELNPEAEALLKYNNIINRWLLTSKYDGSGNTRVVAHIYLDLSGKPLPLQKGVDYTLTLPEGALYYLTDASIVNKEVSVTFKGVEAKPEVQEPELVNAEVSINGFHTATLDAVKGRKLNVSLIPDGNWTVTALTRDGNDVLPFMQENDGVYTTPALTADTKIAATIEYDGVIINDIASEVVEIPETSVKVYSDGEHIVVDGINAGDVVAVYSTNGMLIAEQTMNASDRAMQITIANGQIYIVRVNDKAVKIQH